MNPMLMLRPNPALSFKADTPGVVCPNCFMPMRFFSLFGPGEHAGGIRVRSYIGHCLGCRQTCEVQQFESMGRWHIHQWRVESGPWTVLRPLKADAGPVVQTGPGGDYTNDVTDQQLESMLQQATGTLNKLGHVVCEIAGILRERKHG